MERNVMKMSRAEKRASDARMRPVIMRLRRTRTGGRTADYRRGILDGERWAKASASYRDLQVLEEVADDFRKSTGMRQNEDRGHDLAWAVATYLHLRYGEAHAADEVENKMFPGPDRRRSSSYVSGYILGAIGVWGRVQRWI